MTMVIMAAKGFLAILLTYSERVLGPNSYCKKPEDL
jgi:hypothetical protein